MERRTFNNEFQRAKNMREFGAAVSYWAGYQRGLKRNYHGENYATEEEHQLWLAAINSNDEVRKEEGRGYRDGLAVR